MALVLALACVLSLIGCSHHRADDRDTQINSTTENEEDTGRETAKTDISIPDFSYAQDSEIYFEGEPGVKTSGFLNTAKADVDFDNISEIAENECTVKWDGCTVYRDTEACVWKVVFYTAGRAGGGQTVYLDDDGKTILIVYGE